MLYIGVMGDTDASSSNRVERDGGLWCRMVDGNSHHQTMSWTSLCITSLVHRPWKNVSFPKGKIEKLFIVLSKEKTVIIIWWLNQQDAWSHICVILYDSEWLSFRLWNIIHAGPSNKNRHSQGNYSLFLATKLGSHAVESCPGPWRQIIVWGRDGSSST